VKILIVEDERPIAQVLADNQEYEGHDVEIAIDGQRGLEIGRSPDLDLILLDLMLPVISGYDVCRTLSEADVSTPIIVLTAKGEEIDKVRGLDLGADDYMTKPVGIGELLARIRAVTRRSQAASSLGVIVFGDAEVDFERLQARMRGKDVHLTPKAFGILKLLVDAGGRPVSRAEILEEVWGMDVFPTTRTVDNHVSELRGAFETDPTEPKHLLTVHGVGYQFGTGKA